MVWLGVLVLVAVLVARFVLLRGVSRDALSVLRRPGSGQGRSSAFDWLMVVIMLGVLVVAIALRLHGATLAICGLVELLCVAAMLRSRART